MQEHNVIQQSDEWFELRKNHFLTASHAQAIGTGGKGLETLVWDKLAERYSSEPKELYTNGDMERGNELEAEARSYYEAETFNQVKEVGFVTNKDISILAGASPDGLVGEDGLVEIKCPNDTKFFRLSVKMEVEPQYDWQMQMQMLITGRQWVDYVVFNPHFERPILIHRVKRDEEKLDKLVKGLKKGEQLAEEIIEQYETKQNEAI